MEGRKITLGAKRPPRPVLQIKGPETVTQQANVTQDVLTLSEPVTPSSSSFSPCPSPPLSAGSAVYSSQSKVKASSPRKCMEEEHSPVGTKLVQIHKMRAYPSSSFQVSHHPVANVPSSADCGDDDDGVDPSQRYFLASVPLMCPEQRSVEAASGEGDWSRTSSVGGVAGQTRGVGEGSSLESLLTDGSGSLSEELHVSRSSSVSVSSTSSSSSSYSRPWAPPKGFWRVARPGTLTLDGDSGVPGEMPLLCESGSLHTKPKMNLGGALVSESFGQPLQADSVAGHVCVDWPHQTGPGQSLEEMWQMDCVPNSDTLGCMSERSQRVIMHMQAIRRRQANRTEVAAAYLDGLYCQGDEDRAEGSSGVINVAESELVYTVSPYEFEQIYRCLVTADDLPLSPRHEQAKRLLERARLKARSQIAKGEPPACFTSGKVPDLVAESTQCQKPILEVTGRRSRDPTLDSALVQRTARATSQKESDSREQPSGTPIHHKAVQVASQEEPARDVAPDSPAQLKDMAQTSLEGISRDQATEMSQLQRSIPTTTQEEVSRDISTGSPPLHKASLVAQEELPIAPIKLVDVRGREWERGCRSRRVGQSPTRVRFEDESEKEAERRYLERVRQRGPVVTEKSSSLSKSDPSRSISMKSHRKEEENSMLSQVITPQEEVVGKCDACGSVLEIIISKDAQGKAVLSTAGGRSKFVPKWVSPSQQEESMAYSIGQTELSLGIDLADAMERIAAAAAATSEAATVSDDGAGEQMVSGFGKLRRRSLKGERREEAGHVLGPYARSQDLWAQRRNSYSKMRANMEEGNLLFAQKMSIPNAPSVTFAIDLPTTQGHTMSTTNTSSILKESSPQLPLKSALKSSSKTQSGGPRLVLTTGAPPAGLTPCLKSSLRYSPSKVSPDLPSQDLWENSSEAVAGHLGGEEASGACASSLSLEYRSALRSSGISKADDLRLELLRAEHRKAELMWEDMPEGTRRAMMEQEGKSKLSLRRFFSAMGLNSVGKLVKGNRSSSMDHLCSPSSRHMALAPTPASTSPSPTHRSHGPLQRTPSLQSLHTESPLAQLRKVSSVQSLQSPKRLKERSTILGTVPYNLAPREFDPDPCLGEAEVPPRGPQGRLVQAYPDGTLHIELSRPANGPFGFVISRGKNRPNSGVFVEQVGDNSTDGIYTGLLGVGDEILEVNGETVAGLSLDQVTRLMTRDSTASIRIIPHRWIQS